MYPAHKRHNDVKKFGTLDSLPARYYSRDKRNNVSQKGTNEQEFFSFMFIK